MSARGEAAEGLHAIRAIRVDVAAHVFSALGDRTRLALVQDLGSGAERSATALARRLPVTRQAVVKHLRVLEDAGLVTSRRDGRSVLYAVRPERVVEARAFLEVVSARWDRALAKLRALVEESPPRRPMPSARTKRRRPRALPTGDSR